MKLLMCTACNTVFNLKMGEDRKCDCGACGGRYIDPINAEYWGNPSTTFMLGFANSTLVSAIRAQREHGDSTDTMPYAGRQVAKGREFTAFIVPESAPSIVRLAIDAQDR